MFSVLTSPLHSHQPSLLLCPSVSPACPSGRYTAQPGRLPPHLLPSFLCGFTQDLSLTLRFFLTFKIQAPSSASSGLSHSACLALVPCRLRYRPQYPLSAPSAELSCPVLAHQCSPQLPTVSSFSWSRLIVEVKKKSLFLISEIMSFQINLALCLELTSIVNRISFSYSRNSITEFQHLRK